MSVQAIGWVLDNSKSRLGAKLVLISIANHARSDGTGAWPSVSTIAREAGLSDRQVQKLLPELERSGELIIEREAGPKGCHLYTVRMGLKRGPGEHNSPGEDNSPGEQSSKKGVNFRVKNGAKSSPEPSLNRPVNRPGGDMNTANTHENRPHQAANVSNRKDFFSDVKGQASKAGLDKRTLDTWIAPMELIGIGPHWTPIISVPTQDFALNVPTRVTDALIQAFIARGEHVEKLMFVSESSTTP